MQESSHSAASRRQSGQTRWKWSTSCWHELPAVHSCRQHQHQNIDGGLHERGFNHLMLEGEGRTRDSKPWIGLSNDRQRGGRQATSLTKTE